MLPSIGNLVIYTKFKINQAEIIKTICIQRNSPINSCQGHCALKKSLKALAENEKQMQNNFKEKHELLYVQNTLERTISIFNFTIVEEKKYSYFEKNPISVKLSNFRPPCFFI